MPTSSSTLFVMDGIMISLAGEGHRSQIPPTLSKGIKAETLTGASQGSLTGDVLDKYGVYGLSFRDSYSLHHRSLI